MSKQFIVHRFAPDSTSGPEFVSLSGNYYHKTDLHFVNVLEDPIPSELFKKLLSLDCHVSVLGYHIVELKQLKKGVNHMPKQIRHSFNYATRIKMLASVDISTGDRSTISDILSNMSFDNIADLSRAIIRISNGYFRDSALKLAVKERVKYGIKH